MVNSHWWKNFSGRASAPSLGLAQFIRDFNFRVGRLKTGTPARLDAKTINWDVCEEQHSDEDIILSVSQLKK